MKDLNPESDLFIPEGFQVMKQELALFMLASPISFTCVKDIHIQQCLALLRPVEGQKDGDNLILKLRALWFLEKVARHEGVAKRDSVLLQEIF